MKKIVSVLLSVVMLVSMMAGMHLVSYAQTDITDGTSTVNITSTPDAAATVYFTPRQSGVYMLTAPSYFTMYEEKEDGVFDIPEYYYTYCYGEDESGKSVDYVTMIFQSLKQGTRYALVFNWDYGKGEITATHKNNVNYITDIKISAKSKMTDSPYGKKFPGIDFTVKSITRNSSNGKTKKYSTDLLKLDSYTIRQKTNDKYYYIYNNIIKHSKKVSNSTKLKGSYYVIANFKFKKDTDAYIIPYGTSVYVPTSGKSIDRVYQSVTKSGVKVVFEVDANNYAKDGVIYRIGKKSASVVGRTSKKVKNVKIKDKVLKLKVNKISGEAFAKSDITSVSIPKSVTTIQYSAFASCSKLSKVTLPASVTTIQYAAFADCSKLTGVKIPAKVKTIDEGAFTDCKNLKAITVDKKNKNFTAVDGVLFNKKKTVLVQYPAGKKDAKYNVPDSVKELQTYAFGGTKNLKKLYIPKSVTKIDSALLLRKSSITDIYYAGNKEKWKELSKYYYEASAEFIKMHYKAKKFK